MPKHDKLCWLCNPIGVNLFSQSLLTFIAESDLIVGLFCFECAFFPQGYILFLRRGQFWGSFKEKPRNGGKFMAKGTVKWFDDKKGYGFIAPDDGGDDLFIHHSNIDGEGFKSLQDGDAVEYEEGQGRKGPEATKVRVF